MKTSRQKLYLNFDPLILKKRWTHVSWNEWPYYRLGHQIQGANQQEKGSHCIKGSYVYTF